MVHDWKLGALSYLCLSQVLFIGELSLVFKVWSFADYSLCPNIKHPYEFFLKNRVLRSDSRICGKSSVFMC